MFTQSVIWGINAFDQWGVELGKKLADSLAPAVENPSRRMIGTALAALLELRGPLARLMTRGPTSTAACRSAATPERIDAVRVALSAQARFCDRQSAAGAV